MRLVSIMILALACLGCARVEVKYSWRVVNPAASATVTRVYEEGGKRVAEVEFPSSTVRKHLLGAPRVLALVDDGIDPKAGDAVGVRVEEEVGTNGRTRARRYTVALVAADQETILDKVKRKLD